MAELGLFGANLQGYGCAGMGNIAYGLVMQNSNWGFRIALLHLCPGSLGDVPNPLVWLRSTKRHVAPPAGAR